MSALATANEKHAALLATLTAQHVARFWAHVHKLDGNDGCWLWQLGRSTDGYGKVAFGPKGGQLHFRAHRVALYLETGVLGDVALHKKCDTPLCCNPAHLVWGTQKDNRVDCARKGRTAKGDRHGHRTKPGRTPRGGQHPQALLTDEQAAEIRARYRRGNGAELAREFGISRTIVSNVARGKAYAPRSAA